MQLTLCPALAGNTAGLLLSSQLRAMPWALGEPPSLSPRTVSGLRGNDWSVLGFFSTPVTCWPTCLPSQRCWPWGSPLFPSLGPVLTCPGGSLDRRGCRDPCVSCADEQRVAPGLFAALLCREPRGRGHPSQAFPLFVFGQAGPHPSPSFRMSVVQSWCLWAGLPFQALEPRVTAAGDCDDVFGSGCFSGISFNQPSRVCRELLAFHRRGNRPTGARSLPAAPVSGAGEDSHPG